MGTQPGFSTRATSVPNLHCAISIAPLLYTLRQSHYVALTAWNSVDHAGLKFIAFIPTSLLDFIFFFFLKLG